MIKCTNVKKDLRLGGLHSACYRSDTVVQCTPNQLLVCT